MDLAPRISNIDKNYLMNGAMDFFQRFISPSAFTGVSLTTSYSYLTADRWAQQYAGTWGGGTPASCSSTNVPNQLSKYSLNLIGGPSVITDEVDVRQRIESIVASELSSKVVSLGLMMNSDSPSQITLELWVPTARDDYTFSSMIYSNTQSFANDGAWHPIMWNGITLPSTVNGLEVRFRIANNSNLISTNHVYITQVALSKNSTFTGFNRHGGTVMTDLRACLRYFEKSYNLEVNPGTVATGDQGAWYMPAGGLTFMTVGFKEHKRVPLVLVTPYSPDTGSSGVVGSGGGDSSQPAYTVHSQSGILWELNATGPVRFHFTADTEL